MTEQEALDTYGPIVDGRWANESKFMVLLDIQHLELPWVNVAGVHPPHIYCNRFFAPHLIAALTNVKDRGLESELETFDGCFMIRAVRGKPLATSFHSWGIAIDINAKENPLGGPVTFSPQFLQCFKDAGLTCGAEFHRTDGMHFSLGN